MKTVHEIVSGNSSGMKEVPDRSMNLVVTSPPYPMIKMWDELFSSSNEEIRNALENEDGYRAYDLMHENLNEVWEEVDRVMAPGGIVCINVGDAVRKIGETFRLYSNHSRIIDYFENAGYLVLPAIIWRKQTNKPNKFMGSGMLPPNAYVTLEHEFILIFRRGARTFSSEEKVTRRKSSYFWEERNLWFSDVWTDLKGAGQKLNKKELRGRSAAYPFELAYRLINMYSIQGDTVLDPFLGTGTTTRAAMCSARNSMGYELDRNFTKLLYENVKTLGPFSRECNEKRLKNHADFVEKREVEKGRLMYVSSEYGFRVMTSQETDICLYEIGRMDCIEKKEGYSFELRHEKTESGISALMG